MILEQLVCESIQAASDTFLLVSTVCDCSGDPAFFARLHIVEV